MLNPCALSEAEIVSVLAGCRGATILTFTARTDARLKKTGCPYAGVQKVATVNALVNFHYDAGVVRRLEKEGKPLDTFQKGTAWHLPILGDNGELTPFVQHPNTGELYLRVLCLRVIEEAYIDESGKVLTRDEVAPWLPKEPEYKNQGLDAPLVVKTYKVSGIEVLTLDGNTYHVAA